MTDLQNSTTTPLAYSECYAQVFLGDCLELYKNIEPKSIDLILTDLPYGTTLIVTGKQIGRAHV